MEMELAASTSSTTSLASTSSVSSVSTSSVSDLDNILVCEAQEEKKPLRFYLALSSWTAAFNLVLAGLMTVIWPAQISAILQDSSKDDLYNGFIPAPGALVSLIIGPIVGVASDYAQTKYGRRKVFIAGGSVLTVIFLIIMASFNKNSKYGSVFALMAFICAFQFGLHVAMVPFSALMPDVVHPSKLGVASGWHGVFSAIGNIVGTLGPGFLVDHGGDDNFWPAYMYTTAFFVVFALPTILCIKEKYTERTVQDPCKRILHTYIILDPKLYKSFYWVIITRALFNMGVYSFLPYLQYFLKDIIKVGRPASMASICLGILIAFSIPATLISGYLSDKYGRKAMVYVSSCVMALGAALVAILAYYPSLVGLFCISVVLGIGYGVFMAVDWALAMDVLPKGTTSIARDFGIWQLSLVIPNAIAPAIAGGLLHGVKQNHTQSAAYCTLLLYISAWFCLACGFIYFIVVPPRPTSPPKINEK